MVCADNVLAERYLWNFELKGNRGANHSPLKIILYGKDKNHSLR